MARQVAGPREKGTPNLAIPIPGRVAGRKASRLDPELWGIRRSAVAPVPATGKVAHMHKPVELDAETYAALERLALAKNLTPAELIASLIGADRPPLAGDLLLFYLTGPDFPAQADATERYLTLLAWCARNYAADFADFISHQESGLHYLMFSRDEINEVRARNHARQIDGTQFWAVMSIDDATRRRFVCRLLEFIGCHDETVAQACRALGLEVPSGGFRLLSA
jgi:hypothetical protein